MTQYQEEQHTDANGYQYTTVSNDENNVRTYKLENGLTVYLAQNFDAPRIQTYIAVRAGSNSDPEDNTGLAHYLEHMMFKGTSKIGTQNWNEEKLLLDKISDLFEKHKNEQNPEAKKEIYREIDALSQEASKYAIANEYDKALSSLGASGTNAHTWLDETVYKNNIPSNELAKWLKVEKERFSDLVLRLFHTELESVYEEYNRAQDNDARLVNYALMALLFPKHPNGQQTTLGKGEHLKNPSMKAIHQYFDEYYIPNNYAIVMVGDLQFDETIRLIDETFGQLPSKPVSQKKNIVEEPIKAVAEKTLKSPTIPRYQMAWRTDSYGSHEAICADLVANILSNKGEVGLLDLNINNAQKALYAQAFSVAFVEYGYISVVIVPKENQTLEEARDLVLAEIERIKNGDFPDWLLPAIINDFKLQRLTGLETADGLATNLYQTFIRRQSWQEEIAEMDVYKSVSKDDIVQFTKAFFKDNYVAVRKEKGENENLIRVDNPGITPVQLNRDASSVFLQDLLNEKSDELQPQFLDYEKEIKTSPLNGRDFSFIKNKYNSVAQLHLIFPFGSDHDREIALATQVLQYLGTSKYSTDALKQEFYKMGISHDFKTLPDQLIISVTGLEENIGKGLELLLHWMEDAVPEQDVYNTFVQTILESRAAAKKDKNRIMSALQQYAKYGSNSRLRDVISEEKLLATDCKTLTDKIAALQRHAFHIFYYGQDHNSAEEMLKRLLKPVSLDKPSQKLYAESETGGKVYFVDYDMVQVEISKVARAKTVDTTLFGRINVFNEYFGSGLSSVVFQEIRESKSLAYSAYVAYQANPENGHHDYVTAYLGTQPDKLVIALDTLESLMKDLPAYEIQFNSAKLAALKQLATGRITRTNIFYHFLRMKKLGINYDLRKDIYNEIEQLDFKTLASFYHERLKELQFNTAVLGSEKAVVPVLQQKFANVEVLSLEELFGY